MQIRPGTIRSFLKRMLFLILLFDCTTFVCDIAQAQSSREEEIAQQQAEKAKHLEPYTPNKAEKILNRVQNFLSAPQNFYPMFILFIVVKQQIWQLAEI